jgi:outer membrane protein assembly factor BamE (lipoprotein component of BamABCDE complex)
MVYYAPDLLLSLTFLKEKKMRKVALLLLLVFFGGCISDAEKSLSDSREQEMTLGRAQKEIRVGMSQADVAAALGSPNIVSKDSEGNESWIYDKIATQVSYARDTGGISAGATSLVPTWLLALSGQAQYSKSTGTSTQTQKTLTIVIKFDENSLVKNLSYHASKF